MGEGERIKLLEIDDSMKAERLVDFLENEKVDVSAREATVGPLGGLGTTWVIDVAKSDEAKALELLAAFEKDDTAPQFEESAKPSEPEPTEMLSADSTARYRRASIAVLGLSVVSIILRALSHVPIPFGIFLSCVFDFLIWRRFSDTVPLSTARKVRFFALSRVVIGVVVSVAATLQGTVLEALQLLVLAFAAALYFGAPVPAANVTPRA
ncbi:MAG: hypothetical protein QM817_38885 [Archangium sp.]